MKGKRVRVQSALKVRAQVCKRVTAAKFEWLVYLRPMRLVAMRQMGRAAVACTVRDDADADQRRALKNRLRTTIANIGKGTASKKVGEDKANIEEGSHNFPGIDLTPPSNG